MSSLISRRSEVLGEGPRSVFTWREGGRGGEGMKGEGRRCGNHGSVGGRSK